MEVAIAMHVLQSAQNVMSPKLDLALWKQLALLLLHGLIQIAVLLFQYILERCLWGSDTFSSQKFEAYLGPEAFLDVTGKLKIE